VNILKIRKTVIKRTISVVSATLLVFNTFPSYAYEDDAQSLLENILNVSYIDEVFRSEDFSAFPAELGEPDESIYTELVEEDYALAVEGGAKANILPQDEMCDIYDGSVATGFAAGDGSEENPYIIKTGSQLAYLAKTVNEGESYSGKFFKLTKNLDLNNQEWTPIGSYDCRLDKTSLSGQLYFAGISVILRSIDAAGADVCSLRKSKCKEICYGRAKRTDGTGDGAGDRGGADR